MVLFVMVVAYLQNRYGSLFRAREQFLMQLSRWPQMDDHMWIQSLAVSTCAVTLQGASLYSRRLSSTNYRCSQDYAYTSSSHCAPMYLTSFLC